MSGISLGSEKVNGGTHVKYVVLHLKFSSFLWPDTSLMSRFGHIQNVFDVKPMDRRTTFKTFCNYEMPLGLRGGFAHMADYISSQILYPPGIHTLAM